MKKMSPSMKGGIGMQKIFKRLFVCLAGLIMLLTMAITTEVQAQEEIGTMVLVKGGTYWQSP